MATLPVRIAAGTQLYTPTINTNYYDYNGRCFIAALHTYIKYQPIIKESYSYSVNSNGSAGTLPNIINTFYTVGISTTTRPII